MIPVSEQENTNPKQSQPPNLRKLALTLNIQSLKKMPTVQITQQEQNYPTQPQPQPQEQPTSTLQLPTYETSQKFHQKYELKQVLGSGSSGMANKCIKRDTQIPYVVKRTTCQLQQILTMKKSYNTIKMLSHPNIIKYKSLYISPSLYRSYLVMQYYPYPPLSQAKIESEQEMQSIVFQIFDAISYMHGMGLCHRDIKPDNILYNQEERMIKIIDFGVSREIGTGIYKKNMMTCTGTTEYKAPEQFRGGFYDQLIDQYAAGVTIYELITGTTPFYSSEYVMDSIKNIENCKLSFEGLKWNSYPYFVKDLISSLVCPRQSRITAEQAKNSLWFEKGHKEFCQSLTHKPSKKQQTKNMITMTIQGAPTGLSSSKSEQPEIDRTVQVRALRGSISGLTGMTGVPQEESDYEISDEELDEKILRGSGNYLRASGGIAGRAGVELPEEGKEGVSGEREEKIYQ